MLNVRMDNVGNVDQATWARWGKKLKVFVAFFIVGAILMGSWYIVPSGHMGILVRAGKPLEEPKTEGLNFKIPIIDVAHYISIQPLKVEAPRLDAVTAPPDLQSVTTDVAVNFSPDQSQIVEIYRDFRTPEVMAERVLIPALEEALKASTAKYSAGDLIGKRDTVRSDFIKLLRDKVKPYGITINDVFMTQFKFSDAFSKAIEGKVTANEQANKAENEVRTAKAEAEKRIAQAEGEAKAIKAQAEAIEKAGGESYVKLKWIEKWDGKLPQTQMGGATPVMVNLGK